VHLEANVMAPVILTKLVLPQMLERGDGGILVGHGLSAVEGTPYMSGVGPVMAATRNYLYSLNGELASRGVYAGTLAIAAMIERSESHQALAAGELSFDLPGDVPIPTVDPDDLAEQFWNLLSKRDQVEQVHPPATL
jgi:short-subunit dehydrogenase